MYLGPIADSPTFINTDNYNTKMDINKNYLSTYSIEYELVRMAIKNILSEEHPVLIPKIFKYKLSRIFTFDIDVMHFQSKYSSERWVFTFKILGTEAYIFASYTDHGNILII